MMIPTLAAAKRTIQPGTRLDLVYARYYASPQPLIVSRVEPSGFYVVPLTEINNGKRSMPPKVWWPRRAEFFGIVPAKHPDMRGRTFFLREGSDATHYEPPGAPMLIFMLMPADS